MLKIVTVVGARPQFIKAAAINRAFRKGYADQVKELIVHTGQHYDANMSNVFFEELEIDKPSYSLQIGSGNHGKQTGEMIGAIEDVLLAEQPNAVIVYGDTNSTLAGALAAAKLNIPVIHIEAGIRSYNRTMPEEINRIMTDHVSTLLFSPTMTGVVNLEDEGINRKKPIAIYPHTPQCYHCGDIMYDNSLYFAEAAERKSDILKRLGLEGQKFVLVTIHRNSNTDVPERLSNIFKGVIDIAEKLGVKAVLPLHPRTKKMLDEPVHKALKADLEKRDNMILIEPVGFLEMSLLERECEMILTDSGGVQKEAYFFNKQCLVMRPETEWVEIVQHGSAVLVDAAYDRMIAGFEQVRQNSPKSFPPIFGNGKAAEFITGKIVEFLAGRG